MRKATWLIFALALALTTAQAQKATWNLSRDLRATNNEISFNQGSNGVWYFMESASDRQIPSTYSFLPVYVAPCTGGIREVPIIGVNCWRDISLQEQHAPLVGVNFTNQTQVFNLTDTIPPHAVWMHPAPGNIVIVAWKSPLFAVVSVTGSSKRVAIGWRREISRTVAHRVLAFQPFPFPQVRFCISWLTPRMETLAVTPHS
jgi:hypothetical protein